MLDACQVSQNDGDIRFVPTVTPVPVIRLLGQKAQEDNGGSEEKPAGDTGALGKIKVLHQQRLNAVAHSLQVPSR